MKRRTGDSVVNTFSFTPLLSRDDDVWSKMNYFNNY